MLFIFSSYVEIIKIYGPLRILMWLMHYIFIVDQAIAYTNNKRRHLLKHILISAIKTNF